MRVWSQRPAPKQRQRSNHNCQLSGTAIFFAKLMETINGMMSLVNGFRETLWKYTALAILPPVLTMLLLAGATAPSTPAESAAEKLDYIYRNGQKPHPDPRPTQLKEAEANAYLASGKVKLPAGVQSVHLTGISGAITANCRIDFDQVKAGRGGSNPLLQLFSGVHEVIVQANASGTNYQGRVHVNSVSLDGVEVPQFVLELFVEKYVAS